MKNEIIVKTEKDYKISKWSGGDTTELYLWPEEGDYKSGEFKLRISSATVDTEESEFTKLPGVERYLMIFKGHLDLIHGDKEKVHLEPYETDHFDGGISTHSFGRVVDFNLMLKNGAKGRMEALCLEENQEAVFGPEERENFLALYVREGELEIQGICIKENQTAVIKNWGDKLLVRNAGQGMAKGGVCRAEL